METELSTKWRSDQICEALSIEKSAYYNRLKYLEIEPGRDDEGSYLNAEQMKRMEELNEHIRKTGKMRGFRGSGELALSESSGLAWEIPEQPEIPGTQEDDRDGLEELIREAAELKVQQMAMPELVKLHLAAGMTEDDLPDDLKAKLEAVREAANPNPKQNAAAIASNLLTRYRATRSGGN
jgi:hypothetical protein